MNVQIQQHMSLIWKIQVSLEGTYSTLSQEENKSPPGKGRLRRPQKTRQTVQPYRHPWKALQAGYFKSMKLGNWEMNDSMSKFIVI